MEMHVFHIGSIILNLTFQRRYTGFMTGPPAGPVCSYTVSSTIYMAPSFQLEITTQLYLTAYINAVIVKIIIRH